MEKSKSSAGSSPAPPQQQEAHLGPDQAIALYSFAAELPSDLNLTEGDVITVTGVVEGGQWLLGHCNGRSGQFPANFVSGIPPNLPVVTL